MSGSNRAAGRASARPLQLLWVVALLGAAGCVSGGSDTEPPRCDDTCDREMERCLTHGPQVSQYQCEEQRRACQAACPPG